MRALPASLGYLSTCNLGVHGATVPPQQHVSSQLVQDFKAAELKGEQETSLGTGMGTRSRQKKPEAPQMRTNPKAITPEVQGETQQHPNTTLSKHLDVQSWELGK